MEEARLLPSDDTWHAEEISDLKNADQLDWRCRGCEAAVDPVAWDGQRQYKISAL